MDNLNDVSFSDVPIAELRKVYLVTRGMWIPIYRKDISSIKIKTLGKLKCDLFSEVDANSSYASLGFCLALKRSKVDKSLMRLIRHNTDNVVGFILVFKDKVMERHFLLIRCDYGDSYIDGIKTFEFNDDDTATISAIALDDK